MVLTKQQTADIMTYLLEEVFDQPKDSDLSKAFKHEGLNDPHSIVADMEHKFNNLKYPTDGKHATISKAMQVS